MKKTVFLILFFSFCTVYAFSQCNPFTDQTSIILDYFNKNYEISTNLHNDKVGKWSRILNKGTTYRLFLRESDKNFFFQKNWIYKSEKAENTVLYLFSGDSTYINSTFQNGQTKCYFDFHCTKTGMYYFKINYLDNKLLKKLYVKGIISFVSSDE